jgi:hypothetical protein
MNTMDNIENIFENVKKDSSLLNTINIDELLNAIENDSTDYLENKTLSSISNEIFVTINQLDCTEERKKDLCEKLIDYRLVNEIYELHKGKPIKAIKLQTADEQVYQPKISIIGFVLDIKFLDNGTHVLCLKFGKRIFQYKFDNYLTFQKLTDDEHLILMAYEQIQKKI